jgi:hypothetical protein
MEKKKRKVWQVTKHQQQVNSSSASTHRQPDDQFPFSVAAAAAILAFPFPALQKHSPLQQQTRFCHLRVPEIHSQEILHGEPPAKPVFRRDPAARPKRSRPIKNETLAVGNARSGGPPLRGAHLAANWRRSSGSPCAFSRAPARPAARSRPSVPSTPPLPRRPIPPRELVASVAPARGRSQCAPRRIARWMRGEVGPARGGLAAVVEKRTGSRVGPARGACGPGTLRTGGARGAGMRGRGAGACGARLGLIFCGAR